MKEYALYLWPCFLMAFALLGFNIGFVWLEWRQVIKHCHRSMGTQ